MVFQSNNYLELSLLKTQQITDTERIIQVTNNMTRHLLTLRES